MLSARAAEDQPIAELTLTGGQEVGRTVNGANEAGKSQFYDDVDLGALSKLRT
jgi:hypothetical protein